MAVIDPVEEPRLYRWEKITEVPMMAMAILFLAAYAVPIIWPGIPLGWQQFCAIVTLVIWIVFAAEYVARFLMANHRWWFFKHNIFDLIVVVVPILRPLRALRAVSIITIAARKTKGDQRIRTTAFVVSASLLLAFIAALAVTDAEREAGNANITNFGSGLWWAITTMSTVGYGDTYPVTVEGRIIAGGLMVTGIALLGVITASLAGWFVEKVDDESEKTRQDNRDTVEAQLEAIHNDLASLTDALRATGLNVAAPSEFPQSGEELKEDPPNRD